MCNCDRRHSVFTKILKKITKMKTINLFLTVVLSLLFSSCGDKYDNTTSLYFKTIVPKEELELRSSDPESSVSDSSEIVLLFTGIEVEWFNGTTRELSLKANRSYQPPPVVVANIIFCLNEEILFELPTVIDLMSYWFDYPVLEYDFENKKLHICKGYPDWDYQTDPELCQKNIEISGHCWMEDRDKNWKAIEPGWNKFIKQLKKEGRYRE